VPYPDNHAFAIGLHINFAAAHEFLVAAYENTSIVNPDMTSSVASPVVHPPRKNHCASNSIGANVTVALVVHPSGTNPEPTYHFDRTTRLIANAKYLAVDAEFDPPRLHHYSNADGTPSALSLAEACVLVRVRAEVMEFHLGLHHEFARW